MAQKKEIRTEILINATPEQVWNTFYAFDTYPEWNPFISSLTGDISVGKKFKVVLDGMTFKPVLLVLKPKQEFRWKGTLLIKGLFDGEHIFEIIDHGNGTCTFIQREKFNGLLVGLLRKKLDNETKPGFEKMNEALKARAEKS